MKKITLSGIELVAYRIQVNNMAVIVFDLFPSSNLQFLVEICLRLPNIIQHDGHYDRSHSRMDTSEKLKMQIQVKNAFETNIRFHLWGL